VHCVHPSLPAFPTRRSSDLARAGIAAYRWSAFQQESETIYHQTGHLPGHKLGSPGIRGKVHYSNREETPMSICPILVREKRRRRSEEHTSELQSRENLVCRL